MDTNPNDEGMIGNKPELAEDVEGHLNRGSAVEGPATDDVEGHALPGRFRPDEEAMFGEDDTEGHGIRGSGPGGGRAASNRFRPDEGEMFGETDSPGSRD